MGNFNIPNMKKEDKIDNVKSSDLHTRYHSRNSTYISLELLLGNKIGNKYLHDYKRYNIIDTINDNNVSYIDRNSPGLYKKEVPYNMLDLFMNVSTRVDKEYKYEILANTRSAMNRINIPVYIDESEEDTTVKRKDFIQLIQGLDFEISYLEKKETYSIGDMGFDSFLLFDDQSDRPVAEKRYYNYKSNGSNTADFMNVYRHKYVFDGFNRWFDSNVSETTGSWTTGTKKKGVELLHYEYQTKATTVGQRSIYSRHRNSLGNHQYKTKVTFINSVDSTLAIAEQLNNVRYLGSAKGDAGMGLNRKVNLVTHQDMVWGINKSMIAPNMQIDTLNTSNTWNRDYFESKYAMTFIPNYPTVYIGFEEDRRDLPNEYTGMKKVGSIVITFLNFDELGLFPANRDNNNAYWNTDMVYKVKRTATDFSDNTRFNLKIRVPKRDTNLMYKGQSTRGSEIFLIPGYVEYEDDKYRALEYGHYEGDRFFFREKDTIIKMMSIASDSTSNNVMKPRIFRASGLSYTPATPEKDRGWEFKCRNLELMFSDKNENATNWRVDNKPGVSIDDALQFGGPIVGNYGGWVFPPLRFSNIYSKSLGNEEFKNYISAGTFNAISTNGGITREYFNAGCYGMSARDYPVSLGPLLNYMLAHF